MHPKRPIRYRSVVGFLRITVNSVFKEHFECTETHFFESETGEEYMELHFTSTEQVSDTPVNTKIALSISEQPDLDGHYLVSDEKPWFTPIYAAVGEPIALKRHAGIWKRIPPDSSEEDTASVLNL